MLAVNGLRRSTHVIPKLSNELFFIYLYFFQNDFTNNNSFTEYYIYTKMVVVLN